MTITKKQCLMWALIARMNGMIQENQVSLMHGNTEIYSQHYFEEIANQLKVLSDEPEEP